MKKIDLKKGILITFFFGSLLHFTYQISGDNCLVALFSATNESVWEHTKLLIWPTIIWYFLYYQKYGSRIDKKKYFSSLVVNLITGISLIISLFYSYTQALGIENLGIDIGIFLIATIIGYKMGNHYYQYGKGFRLKLALILIIGLYAVMTFYPLSLPIFKL